MSTSTRNTLLWFLLLLLVGLFSLYMVRLPKTVSVEVGPHQTYSWSSDAVLSDSGSSHLYLKSTSGNFTIYDEAGLYVTSGTPQELLLGEVSQTYTADFEPQDGEKYTLESGPADMYSLDPATLQFEYFRYGYLFLFVASLMIAVVSLWTILN